MNAVLGTARPKLRRASKPKSRTGCSTCRRRRIKCDEGIPGCLRCSKAGYACDGYTRNTKSTPVTKKELKVKAFVPIAQKAAPHKIIFQMIPSPSSLSTENETEHRYLCHFQQKTMTGFEGMMNWTLWNHIVMQFSHHQPFVRDYIIAIGAMLKSLEPTADSGKLLPRPKEAPKMSTLHREFALLKYGKAVKSMRAVLVASEPRQTLIACLLIFCFEMLLNNRVPAIIHFISGQRLLMQWREREMLEKGRPPTSVELEDDLCEAFNHLDLQISTISDQRSLKFHVDFLEEGAKAVKLMPETFNDLIEARRYLVLIMGISHHFLATTWEATNTAGLSREFLLKSPGGIPVATGFNIFSTTNIVPVMLPAKQQRYANDISRWFRAFAPHSRNTRLPTVAGEREFHMATLMQIHGIATKISLAGVLFTEECSYDSFLPQFREMLDLIHIIVDAYQKRGGETSPGDNTFSLDLGIIPPLFLLLIRCRDRVLRRHTIAILKIWHAELCWHPRLIAEIGTFLLEVEEEGHPEGPIPETSRAVVTRICEDPGQIDNNAALLQLLQRRGGLNGEPVWKEKLVTFANA